MRINQRGGKLLITIAEKAAENVIYLALSPEVKEVSGKHFA